jgi:asparagine synthase (glutamine-hydrolysing)
VPLGAFLSGGTDSSTVVAAMREVLGGAGEIETFSIGFRESEFNELDHAAEAARRFGTRHHELLVTPDAATALPELVAHHGEPFSDPSSIPTYYLARMTRERVTVALSGDGGDEAFGGYARYVWAWLAGLFDEWPREIVGLLARLARFAGGLARAPGPLRVAGQYVTDAVAPDDQRYLSMAGHFPPWERQALYTADFRAALVGRDDTAAWFHHTLRDSDARQPLDRYIHNDLQGYLSDGIMAKVDIASMTHSLEVRAPLLDHRIVEFGARLPTDLKQRGLKKRVLFKRAVRAHLPPATLSRRKRGFSIPVAAWLRGPLRPMLDDLVLGPRLAARGIFTGEALRRLCAQHQSRRADHGHKLWNLMVLELWARRFLDGRRGAADAGSASARPAAAAS